MSNSSRDRREARDFPEGTQGLPEGTRGLLGGLARRLESRVAPLIAPHMPERYYERYCDSVGAQSAHIPALRGLPRATMEYDYRSLFLAAPGSGAPASGGSATVPHKAWDVLTQTPRLLIVGAVGTGKTTFLRSLCWRFAGQVDRADVRWLTFKLFGQAVKELMPVFVDVGAASRERLGLFDAMLQSLADHGFPGAGGFLRERLESGQCVLLLDGLDRAAASSVRAADSSVLAAGSSVRAAGSSVRAAGSGILSQAAEMAAAYPNNIWVATMRPSPLIDSLSGFEKHWLIGTAQADGEALLRRYSDAPGPGAPGLPQAAGVLAAFERSESAARLGANPLMLSAMCLAAQKDLGTSGAVDAERDRRESAPARKDSSQRAMFLGGRGASSETTSSPALPQLYDVCVRTVLGAWPRSGAASGGEAPADDGSPSRSMSEQMEALQQVAYHMLDRRRSSLRESEILAILSQTRDGAQLVDAPDAARLLDSLVATGIVYSEPIGAGGDAEYGGDPPYCLLSPTLCCYLAAQWAAFTGRGMALLDSQLEPQGAPDEQADCGTLYSPVSQDAISLTAGMLSDSRPFLEQIDARVDREPAKWFLLARCIAELPDCDSPLRDKATEELSRLLEHDASEHWSRAAVSIAAMTRQQARDHFSSLIGNAPEAETRRRAAVALGRLGQAWAIPRLGAAVGDADPRVREQAAWALGFIPDRQSIAVLSRSLYSPFMGVREAAARSLTQQGLIPELTEPVVHTLVEALGARETTSAGQATPSEPDVSRSASPQTPARGGARPTLGTEIAALAETALCELAASPSASTTTRALLLEIIDNGRLRGASSLTALQSRRIARTLGRSREARALPTLIGAIVGDGTLHGGISQAAESGAELSGYIDAAAQIGPPAIPALIEALQGRDVVTNGGLIAALAKIGAPSVGPLIEVLAGSATETRSGPEVRAAAMRALQQIGEPAIEPLTQALLSDTRIQARRRALEILGAIGKEYVVAALIKALDDPDIGVRINAVRHLGTLAQSQAERASEAEAQEGARAVASSGRPTAESALAQAVPVLVDLLIPSGVEEVGSDSEPSTPPVNAKVGDGASPQADSVHAPPAASATLTNSLRRAAATTLGAIGDERAIGPLLRCMVDPEVSMAASSALGEFGDPSGGRVVEPLIQVIHDPASLGEIGMRPDALSTVRSLSNQTPMPSRARVLSEAAWDVLERIGARARPEDADIFGLARTYAGLRDDSLSPLEILALTEGLSWWVHGPSYHQCLETAWSLSEVNDLGDAGTCDSHFAWLSESPRQRGPGAQSATAHGTWLGPAGAGSYLRDIVRGLRDVVENINVFRSLTRQDSQRNALVSALDRLEQIGKLIQAHALPFERTILETVSSRWHDMIFSAIVGLRGRASLLVDLLTPVLPMRASQVITTAVFQLFNEGDSIARNLSVSLRSAELQGRTGGVEVINGEHIDLNPLGIGEARQVQVGLAPNRGTSVSLTFEAHYDDDERQGVTYQLGFQIRFYEAPDTYTPIERSPYIVGMPVKTQEMFFGRGDIFDWVRENVSGKHQEQALLLYGERRMGKTSVLYQLIRRPPTPQHTCVLFDLQLYGYVDTVDMLLFELASTVAMGLQDASESGEPVDIPDPAESPGEDAFAEHPYRAFTQFCDSVDRALGDRRLLIMLDEFGVLIGKVRDNVLDAAIFDYLRGITQRSNKFTFLFTGAYEVRRMQQDFDSILFNMPKVRKISYLTEAEVQDLILNPVEGMLTYHPLVMQRIRTVTAGHPYFTQYICDELVKLARKQETNYIELTDLEYVIRNVLQDAAGNIENSIFKYLGGEEKLVLATLAHVTDDVRVYVPLGDVVGLLERRRLSLPRDSVVRALGALGERDLVSEMRIGQQLRYSFTMGLTRMWLRQNEILLRLGQETGL